MKYKVSFEFETSAKIRSCDECSFLDYYEEFTTDNNYCLLMKYADNDSIENEQTRPVWCPLDEVIE